MSRDFCAYFGTESARRIAEAINETIAQSANGEVPGVNHRTDNGLRTESRT